MRGGATGDTLDLDRDSAPLWAVLDRVGQEIEDHPLYAPGIPQTHDRPCRGVNLHVTAGGRDDFLRAVARQGDKIRWLGFERYALLTPITRHVDDVVEEEGHPHAHRVDRGQAVVEPLRVRCLAPPHQSLE